MNYRSARQFPTKANVLRYIGEMGDPCGIYRSLPELLETDFRPDEYKN